MSDETTVEPVTVTDDGNPNHGVIVTSTPAGAWFKPTTVTLILLTGLLAMCSLTAAIFFLAPAVSRLTAGDREAVEERLALQSELKAVRQAADETQRTRACFEMYQDDLDVAAGLSQVALSDLFKAAVQRDPPLTEAERKAAVVDNRHLIEVLDEANAPLREAVDALTEYRALDPPPDRCPHPRAAP